MKDGVKRYGELRRRIKGITPKMLTHVLWKLEEDRLMGRTVYYEVPLKVDYWLAQSVQQLIPFIQLLSKWGEAQIL